MRGEATPITKKKNLKTKHCERLNHHFCRNFFHSHSFFVKSLKKIQYVKCSSSSTSHIKSFMLVDQNKHSPQRENAKSKRDVATQHWWRHFCLTSWVSVSQFVFLSLSVFFGVEWFDITVGVAVKEARVELVQHGSWGLVGLDVGSRHVSPSQRTCYHFQIRNFWNGMKETKMTN